MGWKGGCFDDISGWVTCLVIYLVEGLLGGLLGILLCHLVVGVPEHVAGGWGHTVKGFCDYVLLCL